MRLIDADALMETLEKLQRNADKCIPVERGIWMGFNYSLTEIKGSPIVDAVQVVRCGQCKFFRTEKCTSREDGWYCADGERKDDGND